MLAYVGWMGAPYLHSIVARDAAVTSWIYIASAPIDGVIDNYPLKAGQRVAGDGRITTVLNDRVDPTAADTAVARLTEAEARINALTQQTAAVQEMIARREAQRDGYAQVFMADLQTEIDTATAELDALDRQLALQMQMAARVAKLAKSGHGSQSDADEGAAQVVAIERERATHQRMIERATLRLEAAKRGIFLMEDGGDPAWAYRDLDPLRSDLLNLDNELVSARSLLEVAQAKLQGIHRHYRSLTQGDVQAPAGVMIWSLSAGPGSTVAAGTPVAYWLDCSAMLIDVPASDAEIALIRIGSTAQVVLEGESDERSGRVLLTRGAAATLGTSDLAAVAKGRRPGTGQVLVQLSPTPADIEACPVGNAAYVNFPDVGLLDILRVRLRL